jgi:hypothetical protein
MNRWSKGAWHRYMMQGKMEDPRKKDEAGQYWVR